MKKIFFTIVCILSAAFVCAQNATEKSKHIIVIEGCFFNEMPVSGRKIAKMYLLKTPDGATATGITLVDSLPALAMQYAIPKDSVPNAEQLLQAYNDHIAKSDATAVVCAVQNNAGLKEGDKMPFFSATDIDGRKWSSNDVKGKVMVLNLWFTGCSPCRNEMPELSEWKNEMPDVMFFSSTFESEKKARPVIEAKKFNWIHFVDDNQFGEFVGNNGYPVTVVVDKDGTIAKVEYGSAPVQRIELKEKIKSLR